MKKDRLKEYNHQYYLLNREHLLALHKENYWKNKKRYQEWHKKYQQNPQRKEYLKKYYKKNRKRRNAYYKKWRKSRPSKNL